jgi:biotin/methionine sulfoxide reductase
MRLGSAPETIIVHEPWWTATARRADIVLPATTQFEREDIGWAKGDPYLFHMPQMIKPVGDAKDDYDIFYLLAKRMGCCEAFSDKRSSEQWIKKIYQEFATNAHADDVDVPNWEELKAQNFVRLNIDAEEFDNVPFEAFRKSPNSNPLATPSGKIEIYSRAIAGFKYDDVPGTSSFSSHPAKTMNIHCD